MFVYAAKNIIKFLRRNEWSYSIIMKNPAMAGYEDRNLEAFSYFSSKAEQISVGEGNLFDIRQITDEEKSCP